MKKSNKFRVLVVACDKIKTPWSNGIAAEEVSAMLSKHNIEHSVDISLLKLIKYAPSFIFASTPYDEYLKPTFHSKYLSMFSKLCHVSYGAVLIEWVDEYADMYNKTFIKNCHYFFVESPSLFPDNHKFVPIGLLKLDEYIYYGRKYKTFETFTIAWKPRWIMDEGYSIQKYISFFTEIASKGINVIFVSHPLLFTELNKAKYPDCFRVLEDFFKLKNVSKIVGDDFLDYVLGADVLVADISSTIAEFLWTEKPIVCTNSEMVKLNAIGRLIINASYCVTNESELGCVISEISRNNDYKKIKRDGLFDRLFNPFEDNKIPTIRLIEMLATIGIKTKADKNIM